MKKWLLVVLSFGFAGAVSFVPVTEIPTGTVNLYGVIALFDSDHDSYVDLHFMGAHSRDNMVYFYSYRPFNRLVPRDSVRWPSGSGAWMVWAAGDLDGDSLADMVVAELCSVAVFEAQDVSSFPKAPVWQLPYLMSGTAAVHSVDDFDQDGKMDIIYQDRIPPQQIPLLRILENSGNNVYSLVFEQMRYSNSRAFADFDLDARRDMATGCGGRDVTVFECVGDNQYEWKWVDSTVYPNCGDVFSAEDADGDGKPEFTVTWMRYDGLWTVGLLVYETSGNDRYGLIYHDSVCGIRFPRTEAMSSSGDVDSDGVPEIIWAIGDDWYVYEATGNDLFQRVFEAYPRPNGNGHRSTQVYVNDMNGNGYPEIIESGTIDSAYVRTETKVWEIEGVRLHRPNGGEVLSPRSQYPITWEKFSPPGADSFSLFVSFDDARTFQTITTGLLSSDTLFLWTVPDTVADSCKIMIWAYGPPRAGQNVPRGTAWNFSDSTFRIGQTRVREAMSNEQRAMSLRILQNPTTTKQGIRYQVLGVGDRGARLNVYDVAGKLVHSVALSSLPSAPWSIALPAGVYFVRLETRQRPGQPTYERGSPVATQKVVVLE